MNRWCCRAIATCASLIVLSRSAGAQRQGACDGHEKTVRQTVAATIFVGGNVALYEYFKSAWWSGEHADFHFHNDWNENHREQDKFGHLVGGFHLTRFGAALMREACVSRKKAAYWSAAYAAAFQLQIEVWDGLQAKYGFSPPDLLFNTAGAGFALARELSPRMAPFKPTISYSRTLANRTRAQHGGEPRNTVDYSGQTYWLSTDVEALLPERAARYWPGLLRVSVGHSITDYFPPPEFKSVRAEHKILVSLDLDTEKLPGNNPLWRSAKRTLSFYHFPAPALQLTPKAVMIKWYR